MRLLDSFYIWIMKESLVCEKSQAGLFFAWKDAQRVMYGALKPLGAIGSFGNGHRNFSAH